MFDTAISETILCLQHLFYTWLRLLHSTIQTPSFSLSDALSFFYSLWYTLLLLHLFFFSMLIFLFLPFSTPLMCYPIFTFPPVKRISFVLSITMYSLTFSHI